MKYIETRFFAQISKANTNASRALRWLENVDPKRADSHGVTSDINRAVSMLRQVVALVGDIDAHLSQRL